MKQIKKQESLYKECKEFQNVIRLTVTDKR